MGSLKVTVASYDFENPAKLAGVEVGSYVQLKRTAKKRRKLQLGAFAGLDLGKRRAPPHAPGK